MSWRSIVHKGDFFSRSFTKVQYCLDGMGRRSKDHSYSRFTTGHTVLPPPSPQHEHPKPSKTRYIMYRMKNRRYVNSSAADKRRNRSFGLECDQKTCFHVPAVSEPWTSRQYMDSYRLVSRKKFEEWEG